MSNVTKFPNLATDLRKWGLRVVEVSGWQTRSSNWDKGFTPHGIVCHHTAGPNSGNAPSMSYVKKGNSEAPGPLSQFLLARDGTVYLLGGHRANHAGEGGPFRSIPKDSANTYMWGIEAENNGRGEKWGTQQLNAYYRLCAALMVLTVKSKNVEYVIGHKEWAPGRKVDPAGIKMSSFRQRVAQAIAAGPAKKPGGAIDHVNPKPVAGKSHTVVVGDTLWDLANKWRTTVDSIKRLNGLKSDVLNIGQKLKVPQGKAKSDKTPKPTPKPVVKLKNVRPGKTNDDVLVVQKALHKWTSLDYSSGPGKFGPLTQAAYAKWQRHLGYTGKDANGVPGLTSLKELGSHYGFRVVDGS